MRQAVSLSGASTGPAELARACAAGQTEARKILAELTDASAKHYVSPYNLAKIWPRSQKRGGRLSGSKRLTRTPSGFIELKVESVWISSAMIHVSQTAAPWVSRIGD
jgi:hypothetical protein